MALLALVPFVVGILKSKRKERIVAWFLIISAIAIYPRFSYFHLQPVIPFFILLVGLGLKRISTKIKPVYIIFLLSFLFILIRPFYLFNWAGSDRFVDDLNIIVLKKLELEPKENTVFLMGPYSNYYVFSELLPPKPWLDNFNWHYELPNVQEETIISFEGNPPNVVYIDKKTNYLPQKIVDWVHINYNLEEVFETNIEIWRKN